MIKEDAHKILQLYRNWNIEKKSISLARHNIRTFEDDLYDSRRKLIKLATDTLGE